MGFIWGMVIGIIGFNGGVEAWKHHRENQAYECAMKSDRTDIGIEACYAKYNVVFPGYFDAEE